MRTLLIRLPVLFLLTYSVPALAVDGVLEINQTCAVETGCFAGDTAGFPVTIVASGGYRLTSNLAGIPTDTDGIFLNGSRITLDFNGFSLVSGAFGSGTGNGITGLGVDGQFASFPVIKNGAIRGFGGLGVALGLAKGVRIENMIFDANAGGGADAGAEAQIVKNGFSSNGGTSISAGGLGNGLGALIEGNVVSGSGGIGIESGTGSTVSGNTAYLNGGDGIRGGDGSSVLGNTAHQNGSEGISAGVGSTVSDNTTYLNADLGIAAGSGSTVSGNTTYQNGSGGISGTSGSTISGNTAYLNGGDGIRGGDGSAIIGNTARDNGDATNPAFDDGISCSSGCTVQGNTMTGNSGYGLLFLGSASGYRENVVFGNTTGAVTGSAVDAGANVIDGVVTTTP